jgi:hypothetical protein
MPENQSRASADSSVLKTAARKFAVLLLVTGAFAGVWYLGKWRARKKVDHFAQCLSGKGAVMYGLYWCPHCEDQKEMFGPSFRNVRYVECGTPDHHEQPECAEDGLKDFPTWKFADGERHVGGMALQELAVKTGCSAQ